MILYKNNIKLRKTVQTFAYFEKIDSSKINKTLPFEPSNRKIFSLRTPTFPLSVHNKYLFVMDLVPLWGNQRECPKGQRPKGTDPKGQTQRAQDPSGVCPFGAAQTSKKNYHTLSVVKSTSGIQAHPIYKKREKKRRHLILPKHIGRVFFVHNGKTFSSIHISRKMLGHKFGEFASTRKKPLHKKKR